MYRNCVALVLFLCALQSANSQLIGQVSSSEGHALSFVNIYLEGATTGTTTNESGRYELPLDKTGTYTVVFKYLGYGTETRKVSVTHFPYELNVRLNERRLNLNEVTLKAEDNPANSIIKNAIAKRKAFKAAFSNFKANFYSKGLIRIEGAPERILGQDIGDLGGGLDSTRSGIIYLSETLSQITKKKTEFKEKILASKVSGDDNGFSFNNASDVNFSFYDNTVTFGNELISPIAENAFSYYRYRLEGTFYDEGKRLINKIRVTPKRKNDRVFSGELFIVEDDWSIYAVNLSVTGEQAKIIPADTIFLKQEFNYDPKKKKWLKALQRLDFQYSIFGFKGTGRFTATYKDYELSPTLAKKEFTSEILSFEKDANAKDSVFWAQERPVPLTHEEVLDYRTKDSLQVVRKSRSYLDSVDVKANRFTLGSLLFGYTYKNTFKEEAYSLSSPLATASFNTVQGFRGSLDLGYTKRNEERGSRFNVAVSLDYGLSDKRFRPQGAVSYRFNNFSRAYLRLRAGNEAIQFNPNNPITPIGNSIASLFFENNWAKFYERNFIEAFHSQELVNAFTLYTKLSYEERKPLFNTTNYVLIGDNENYTSNNPRDPADFTTPAFSQHSILKLAVTGRIRFGQKYLKYPNAKFNITQDTYPTLFIGYAQGWGTSDANTYFNQLKLRLTQEFPVGDKGRFGYNLRAGTFLNADDVSFVDYEHFNGNRTRITRGDYLNSFFLLPYYDLSTNQRFFEAHLEHNFQGYLMGKIPFINALRPHLILSGKALTIANNDPYYEWGVALGNLGWKKFRFLRVGYVQSHYRGVTEAGLNLGLRF